MSATTLFLLVLMPQQPVSLEPGRPFESVIDSESAQFHTPTLDSEYSNATALSAPFSVSVSKPGPYYFDLISYDFDAYLVLSDSSGAILAEDDDGLLGYHSRIIYQLKADQEYLVHTCALNGAVGEFRIELAAGSPEKLSDEDQWLAKEVDRKRRVTHAQDKYGVGSPEEAKARDLLFALYYYAGKFVPAVDQAKLILDLNEENLGPEDPETLDARNNYSGMLLMLGRYEEARPIFEKTILLQGKVLGPEHIDVANSLNNLAALYQFVGEFTKAQHSYERSLSIYEKEFGHDHVELTATLGNLAACLKAQGNLEEAYPLFARAHAINEKFYGPQHKYVAISLNNLAFITEGKGEHEIARGMFEKALRMKEKVFPPEHPEIAITLVNLGLLLNRQGNYAEALPLLERAVVLNKKAYGANHPMVATCIDALARAQKVQGKHARSLYEQAFAMRRDTLGINHPETVMILNNIAGLHFANGDLEEAESVYRQALTTWETVFGLEHPNVALGQSNLAQTLKDVGEFEEALPLFRSALSIRQQTLGNSHPNTVASQKNLALILVEMGEYENALPHFQLALSAALQRIDNQFPSMNETERLHMLKVTAKPGGYLDCISNIPDLDLNEHYALFQEWKGKAIRLKSASVKLGRMASTPSLRATKGKIQVLAKELSNLVLLPIAEREESHGQRIDDLRKERLRLERELNSQLGLSSVLEIPELAEVQMALPKDSTLVDFFVGKDVYAWIVKPSGSPSLIRLGKATALQEAQASFLSVTTRRGGKSLLDRKPSAEVGYQTLLWKPLQEAIGGSNTVFICPDGFICELPFGILPGEAGGVLLEKHRFVYLSDPVSLVFHEKSSGEDEGSLLAVGGVNYFKRDDADEIGTEGISNRSRVGGTWNSLPATRDEIQALHDLHDFILEWASPMTVVEGKSATEERIRIELPGKRYVHIATHGYFEPEHLPSLLLDAEEKQASAQLGEQLYAVGLLPGLLSGLVFAGVNGDPDPTRDDGYLSAEEIQHLDLSACDLVVLSACETALGSARAGEGLMSLRRSFSVAGADTVISSLWKVDDQATAQLMKDFYTNLWEKNMSRGDALHEAKLRMLRRNRIDNGGDAMPSTWGAFVLSGEWE